MAPSEPLAPQLDEVCRKEAAPVRRHSTSGRALMPALGPAGEVVLWPEASTSSIHQSPAEPASVTGNAGSCCSCCQWAGGPRGDLHAGEGPSTEALGVQTLPGTRAVPGLASGGQQSSSSRCPRRSSLQRAVCPAWAFFPASATKVAAPAPSWAPRPALGACCGPHSLCDVHWCPPITASPALKDAEGPVGQ